MSWRHGVMAGLLGGLVAGALPSSAAAQAMINTGGVMFATRVTSLRDMPFRTVVRQQYDYSCGSAALATLLRYHYGRTVDEAAVFKAMYATGDQAKIRSVGFSLLDMKRYLAAEGLAADGYRETLAELKSAMRPAIAVISIGAYRHFVVVKGVGGGKILVGDPAQGLKAYTEAEFAKVWSGVVFVIHNGGPGGGFNRADDWSGLPHAPSAPLNDTSLAGFTRELPRLYQIAPFQVVGR